MTQLVQINSASAVVIGSLSAGMLVTESEGIGSNDNDTTIATSFAIKDYVDTQITAQDLDFQADSGGALSIDLDSETLSVVGTFNEITTVVQETKSKSDFLIMLLLLET